MNARLPLPSTGSTGRGLGWEAGIDMGNTLGTHMGNTFPFVESFVHSSPAAKRQHLFLPRSGSTEWSATGIGADGSRSFELQFAAPIVRVGAQSPGIPQGGLGGPISASMLLLHLNFWPVLQMLGGCGGDKPNHISNKTHETSN